MLFDKGPEISVLFYMSWIAFILFLWVINLPETGTLIFILFRCKIYSHYWNIVMFVTKIKYQKWEKKLPVLTKQQNMSVPEMAQLYK